VLAALVVVAACALSDARSAWVGAAAGALTWVALDPLHRRRSLLKAAAAIAAISLLLLAIPHTREVVIDALGRVETALHRLRGWATLDALERGPVFGVGYGQYPSVHEEYFPAASEARSPENAYVRWTVECGLAGLAVLGALLAVSVRSMLAANRPAGDGHAPVTRAVLAGWFACAVTFLAFDGFYWAGPNVTFWGLLAIGVRAAAPPAHRAAGSAARPSAP
jgi:O-antigen ligase